MNFWQQFNTALGFRRGKQRPLDAASRDHIQQLLCQNREVEAIAAYRAATHASLRAAVADVKRLKLDVDR